MSSHLVHRSAGASRCLRIDAHETAYVSCSSTTARTWPGNPHGAYGWLPPWLSGNCHTGNRFGIATPSRVEACLNSACDAIFPVASFRRESSAHRRLRRELSASHPCGRNGICPSRIGSASTEAGTLVHTVRRRFLQWRTPRLTPKPSCGKSAGRYRRSRRVAT